MRGKQARVKTIVFHVAICILFLSIPYVFTPDELFVFPDIVHGERDRTQFAIYLLILLFFYINYYFLLPRFYFSKKYVYYCSLVILYFLVISSPLFFEAFRHHPHHTGHFHDMPHGRPMPPPMVHISNTLFLYLTGLFITLFIKANNILKKTEREKLITETSYLKSQINPHFLFNTLNSIYALALKEDANQTATGMLKLSGMMRYVVTESSADFVTLEQEINYINDYIDLQKMRLSKDVKLAYSTRVTDTYKKIAPLVLITFIENAFKHGVSPDEESGIAITIEADTKELKLVVENTKLMTAKNKVTQTGYGIKNTQERLRLTYPLKHDLRISENKTTFTVNLTLVLHD
jgi:hypothetical protein